MSYSTWQKYTPPRACLYGARATSSPGPLIYKLGQDKMAAKLKMAGARLLEAGQKCI